MSDGRAATPPAEGRGGGPMGARDGRGEHEAHLEVRAGGGLVLLTVLAGILFAAWPSPIFVDRWILDVIGPTRNGVLTGVTVLRYPQAVVAGSVILAIVSWPRSRPRSLACLVGPPLALVTCELVIKPLVGRHIGAGLSYPSGSTVGAAALGAALVLAAPLRWRTAAVVVGAAFTLWMSIAVIALQWHYPSDALAGAAYGVGVVLLVDAAAWWAAVRVSPRSAGSRPGPSGGG
jgi:membrane-associated phospholipid phosphatase